MEITHLGHASFKIRGKQASLVTDPFSPQMTGLKFPKIEADIVTVSHNHEDHNAISNVKSQMSNGPLVISGPGEYEVQGVKILGVSTFHDSSAGSERGQNTVYQIKIDGLTLIHLGDLGHKLETKEIEALNGVDILMVPVGGVYTLDGKGATQVVGQLEPRIVIPMHYQVAGLKFELEAVDKFLKELGKEGINPQPKLVITKDKLPEELEVIVLE
ncbi:MBL fold metallo-hydrolase [Candidatus Gottesmanbacteria bacterium]|nr:MBL fold metallo-hydrolase [Candidatus Gottesmanbacteria bacterium]